MGKGIEEQLIVIVAIVFVLDQGRSRRMARMVLVRQPCFLETTVVGYVLAQSCEAVQL